MTRTETVMGYCVSYKKKDLINEVATAILSDDHDRCRYFACLNPHSYYLAKHDAEFEMALKNASWIIPDGVGIVLASKFRKGNIKDRITGYDIFMGINEFLHSNGGKVFLLGSSEANLTSMTTKLGNEFPKLELVGSYSPPFQDKFSREDSDYILKKINKDSPDVLWVGLSAPKQEKWVFENIEKIDAKIAGPIGAVFDFYTNNITRSPLLFQKLGLEWLPRLIQEPRRLWRRTLISAPIFCPRDFLSTKIGTD